MLLTIALILLVLWALGLTTAYTACGLIHILAGACDRSRANSCDSGTAGI